MLPHFVVANLAGLGWIGKNSLLITKQYGPRIGITTILTDAMLPADDPLEMQCGDCQRCVTACPAKAISGVPFHPAHALDIRLSSNKCAQYSEDIRSTWQTDKQEGNMCNKCVAVCPYGVDR